MRRPLHRLLAPAALALALVAVAGPAAARPKPPKPSAVPKVPEIGVPYTVRFSASQTITWNIPRHTYLSDCGREWWTEGSGEETWKVASRGTGRVDINARAGEVQFLYPSADPADSGFSLPAGGERKRRGRIASGFAPGTRCEVDTPQPTPAKTDCGTRLPDYQLAFQYAEGKLAWRLAGARTQGLQGKLGYDNCPLMEPPGMSTTDITDLPQRIAYKKLAGRGSFTVTGTRTFKPPPKDLGQEGVLTTAGKVQWSATFTRVKR